ncbi:DUF6888 family protein [Stenomitos frigidus]|uniref:DUF6888 family protein n=1 Tax=Stenomitos frigidus TaxID=1886765 RepID=UPI003BB79B8B
MPTAAQTLECFSVCYSLTKMYLPIYIVRIDERTGDIFILAGEETIVLINRDGKRTFP